METGLIQTDPAVMMGKPVVAGTRITVELTLDKLAAGETHEQLLNSYPRITRESITTTISYGRDNGSPLQSGVND
jgi:uncharacterized protein (DUF433 family)